MKSPIGGEPPLQPSLICNSAVLFFFAHINFEPISGSEDLASTLRNCRHAMSQFYARYVPPSGKPQQATTTANAPVKRKHDSIPEPAPKKKQKLEDKSLEGAEVHKKQRKRKIHGHSNGIQHFEALATADELAKKSGAEILSKYSSTATSTGKDIRVKAQIKTKDPKTAVEEQSFRHLPRRETTKEKRKKEKKKQKAIANGHVVDEDVQEPNQKHAGVLSRFSKAKADQPPEEQQEVHPDASQKAEVHGLDPLPQPEQAPDSTEKPTYSTLAAWQTDAVRVVQRESKAFSDFALSDRILSNLSKNKLEQSLPIQTTVLPLLLQGPDHHDGDVCVSAATGSGKTLAYLLPMIEELKNYQITKLRGVVVVPTRELVQQVRQLCEICAAGSSLKIAAAAGNKSMKEEQKLLVTEEGIYDPAEYERQQSAPVDWLNFSFASLFREVGDASRLQANFVKRYSSKADILITTPGRLVDHLHSTKGFNLDHVSWLVVDEADRLLNESYQEWIESVTPALQSRAATSKRDELLRKMRMDLPERKVKKVLLSATMTRDVSKLNSLGLENPKLVILGSVPIEDGANIDSERLTNDTHSHQIPNEEGTFHLPSTLSEYAIPIKDGYEKPLYLLQLLESLQFASEGAIEQAGTANAEHDASDNESDSSDAESGSEDDSDTSTSISSSEHPKSNAFLSDRPPRQPRSSSTSALPKALIFTRSTASALRLSRLLSLLSPSLAVYALTRSTSSSATSRQALKAFLSSKTRILIATDRASRGLDIPNLTHVVSYDVPASSLAYVHRVGRTARAGRAGEAWTLVEHREGKWFWDEIGGKSGKGEIVRVKGKRVTRKETMLDEEESGWGCEERRKRYEEALGTLGEEVRGK
jgi:ATP-dependent RNA helicase DDX51/DBP6